MNLAQANFPAVSMPAANGRARLPQTSLRSVDSIKSTHAPIAPKLVREGAASKKTFEEKIFDSLVTLKVAIGNISMHLSRDERHRLFNELDSKINLDDWHEEDRLPDAQAFREFLKWLVFTQSFGWTSLGVSAEGAIMVAWKKTGVLLTATFDGVDSVRWTARVTSPLGEVGISTGKCTLRLFAQQASFYLG